MYTPDVSELPPPPSGKTGWPWTCERADPVSTQVSGSECPRISIVTPSYNQGDFVEATIRSVLLQGYPNLEYFIMNGSSSDASCSPVGHVQAGYRKFGIEVPKGS